MDRSITVRSGFFENPGHGGPVAVSVFSNMDERPDRTGLPSTKYDPKTDLFSYKVWLVLMHCLTLSASMNSLSGTKQHC